ncbi:MAG: endolytic transglycosylase MltG [Alphaproteobacteria bacterium TMED89]|nr:aminodeoxychorismate lyase [Rhodospirillaceae bacterium]RPH14187.1 MAG: endolytic transglycosylase MltG [Alphaproteobacteria bacterium TMED89]
MGAILAAAAVAIMGLGAYWMQPPPSATVEATFVVPRGAGLSQIADDLEAARLINSAEQIVLLARMRGDASSIKAGEFLIPAKANPNDILDILIEGKAVNRFVTVPEGVTVKNVIARLNSADGLTGEVTKIPAEGTLLPNTYSYALNESRQSVIDRMQAAMGAALDAAWEERAADAVVKTRMDALILASIVEKETAVASERPLVASVYSNRLRQGMRLQADPTLVYYLSGGSGRLGRGLKRSELTDENNPYNTYKHAGLPPGPIANPGVEAIRAALAPAESSFIFFVAGCDGATAFTETYAEHQQRVRDWRACEFRRFMPNPPVRRPTTDIPERRDLGEGN